MPAIYIHVPFCLSKCYYCDFVSAIHEQRLAERYTHAVCAELALRSQQYAMLPDVCHDWMKAPSVFLGGGTPTTLSVGQLQQILAASREAFPWQPGAEVTIEANPRTHVFSTPGAMEALREMGINRLSIGAQSFDDEMLRQIGRDHGAADVEKAVQRARHAGFDNVSVDLIFALPGQTLKQWERTLDRALELDTEHISLYNLTIEEGTVFGERYRRDELQPAPSDLEAEMYAAAIRQLTEAGFTQYEISNFARRGLESRHNRAYWRMEEYLGVGVGAHSMIRNVRFAAGRNTLLHTRAIENGNLLEETREELSADDALAEAMWLGLRMMEGVDPEELHHRFGTDPRQRYEAPIRTLISRGLLTWRDGRLALTREGLFLGNAVFCEFV